MKPEKYFGIDNSYQYMNLDERYGDRVPVKLSDYEEFNPSGSFFEWEDGIYEEVDGIGVMIAEVRMPYLEEGETPRVSRQFVESVIVTCIEGGATNRWARVLDYQPEGLTATLQIRSGELEGGATGIYRVTAETIRQGVNLILSGETDVPLETVRLYAREWYLDVDSVEADMILQVGIFGKVIFG